MDKNRDKQKILEEEKEIIKYETIESQSRDSSEELPISSPYGETNRGFSSGGNAKQPQSYPDPDWNAAFQGAEKLFRDSIPPQAEDGQAAFTKPSYSKRKTMSQGAMDFALLMSNLAQLVVLLDVKGKDNTFVIKLLTALTVLSIVLQAVVAILLTIMAQLKVRTSEQETRAERMNEATAVLILVVSIINVINSSMQIQRNGAMSKGGSNQQPVEVVVMNRTDMIKQLGNKLADILP